MSGSRHAAGSAPPTSVGARGGPVAFGTLIPGSRPALAHRASAFGGRDDFITLTDLVPTAITGNSSDLALTPIRFGRVAAGGRGWRLGNGTAGGPPWFQVTPPGGFVCWRFVFFGNDGGFLAAHSGALPTIIWVSSNTSGDNPFAGDWMAFSSGQAVPGSGTFANLIAEQPFGVRPSGGVTSLTVPDTNSGNFLGTGSLELGLPPDRLIQLTIEQFATDDASRTLTLLPGPYPLTDASYASAVTIQAASS